MSSDKPQGSADEPEKVIQSINIATQKFPPAPSPKRIEAESQSRNSYERLFIVRILAIGLAAALGLDVIAYYTVAYFASGESSRAYNDHVKDILIVISAIAAYLLGYGSNEKKEEK